MSYREIERVFSTLMLDDFREPLYIDRQKYIISLMIYLQECPPKQEMNKLRILFIKAMRSENKTAVKVGFESFKMLLEFSDFQYKLPEDLFNYWIFDAEDEDEDISLLAVSILDDDYYRYTESTYSLLERTPELEHYEIRKQMFDVVGDHVRTAEDRLFPIVKAGLDDDHSFVRASCLGALLTRNEGFIDFDLEYSFWHYHRDPAEIVRYEALLASQRLYSGKHIGKESLLDYLVSAIKDKSQKVKRQSVWILEEMVSENDSIPESHIGKIKRYFEKAKADNDVPFLDSLRRLIEKF